MLVQAFRHRYVYDACFTSLWQFLTGMGGAVFSALWFQRLAADAIQSRQLSSTVA